MNESDFYYEDDTCIHCDYTVNYYDEVKEEATKLFEKHNEGLEGDDMACHWDCFIEEAISYVVYQYASVRTTCDCCHDNEN
jgi:hypothetical protein